MAHLFGSAMPEQHIYLPTYGNPIYLPEGRKQMNFHCFKIDASHYIRRISKPNLPTFSLLPLPLSHPHATAATGWEVGERPAARSPPAGVVVEVAAG